MSGLSVGHVTRQLCERLAPTAFVARFRNIILQVRMSEGEFCLAFDRSQFHFDTRDVADPLGTTEDPAQAHDHALRSYHFQIFSARLMLVSVRRSKANQVAAADARITYRRQYRLIIRPPPATYSLGGCQCIEDNRRPCCDSPH